jgi:outer membrane lipoprotein SlyB
MDTDIMMNNFCVRFALLMVMALAAGCSGAGGTRYGEGAAPVLAAGDTQGAREGRIASVERIQVDQNYKFGVGTVVGAVAGGLLGNQIGGGSGRTIATILGAAAGGAAGTAVESKVNKQDAQRVVVNMKSGGQVTIVQPVDNRLSVGLNVRVEGGGETARVVPE